MARVDVYVPDDSSTTRSLVLLVAEVDEADEILDDDRPPARLGRVRVAWDGVGADPVRACSPARSRSLSRWYWLVRPREAGRHGCGERPLGAARRSLDPAPRTAPARTVSRSSSATSSVGSGVTRSPAVLVGAPSELSAPAACSSASPRPCPGWYCSFKGFDDLLGLAAEHRVVLLVHDGAVVEDVEQLGVLVVRRADLGHEDLDLVRLHLVGEHLAEGLRVGVGELAWR